MRDSKKQSKSKNKNNQPDYFLIIVAKLFRIKFSTKKEEILFEFHVVHLNFLIIVHFEDYMLIATVLMHQQNEQHEYHYEIYIKLFY